MLKNSTHVPCQFPDINSNERLNIPKIISFLEEWLDDQCGRDLEGLPSKCAFCNPSRKLLYQIAEYEFPIVEIGSGNAFWAWALNRLGIDIICFDKVIKDELFFPVTESNEAILKEHADRALLLVWPGEELANKALTWYQQSGGKNFFFIPCPYDILENHFNEEFDTNWILKEEKDFISGKFYYYEKKEK